MFFTTTLTMVAVMLCYTIPGFLLVKTKLINTSSISAFAVLLMYVCQPCLTIYSFQKMEYSISLVWNLLIAFSISLVVMAVFLLGFYRILRKKQGDVKYRIYTIATAFGNCTFMGVPILEGLFPDKPETIMYSLSFFLAMSVIAWTMGSFIISRDKKYISIKKLLLNPAVVSMYVAIPLWVIGFRFTGRVNDMITLVGRMTTPICMMVLGMRLAAVRIKPIFTMPAQYITVIIKQILMPGFTFLVMYFLPLDSALKQTIFILSAMPEASVILNFSEMLGEGQESAANIVLLGTMLSIGTVPLMSLLL